MKFKMYERPDGWSKGQPEVFVSHGAIKKLGEPSVNYEGLHQFLTDDLDMPYDSKTFIKLYGQNTKTILGGFHFPYTRTVHVNAPMAEKMYGLKGGTMRIVAHELRHRSDSHNRKLLTAAEIGARVLAVKAGVAIGEHLPVMADHLTASALAGRFTYYAFEPAEIRARRQEKLIVESDHQTDIVFPIAIRTPLLAMAGRLPEAAVNQFGLQDISEAYQRGDVTIDIDDPSGDLQKMFYPNE